MATTDELVELVSQDVGDYWKGTTTGAGSATTLVDTALINEDDDDFVTDRSQIHMLSGGASGESAGFNAKSGATLTVKTGADFSGATGSGASYEVHRLFTRKEKEDAITRALNTIFPQLFNIVQETVTIVTDQHDYTLTNFNYVNQPSSVALQSTGDTELEHLLYDWEIRPDSGKLHLERLPNASRILVVEGIVPAVIGDITVESHKLILSVEAALDLVTQAILNSPSDVVSRWERTKQVLEGIKRVRMQRFAPLAPPITMRTDVYRSTRGRTFKGA